MLCLPACMKKHEYCWGLCGIMQRVLVLHLASTAHPISRIGRQADLDQPKSGAMCPMPPSPFATHSRTPWCAHFVRSPC